MKNYIKRTVIFSIVKENLLKKSRAPNRNLKVSIVRERPLKKKIHRLEKDHFFKFRNPTHYSTTV